MNTKILSVIFLIFMGFGFSSCKDKDEKNQTNQYDAGLEAGTKFREAFEVYTNSENAVQKTAAGVALFSSYKAYKTNSGNAEWKDGFLNGAVKADEIADNTKNKLMELLDNSSVDNALQLIEILSELFLGN
jgi:hypothetical protein